jgi:hypothetical protein
MSKNNVIKIIFEVLRVAKKKKRYLLGSEVMQPGKCSLIFQRNILPLSSGLKHEVRKEQARDKQSEPKDRLHSSETSVNFYKTTWHHIPEDN